MLTKLQRFNKLWVALVAALGALVLACAPIDGEAAFVVTRTEWYMVVVAFAAAAGVYQAPNKKG